MTSTPAMSAVPAAPAAGRSPNATTRWRRVLGAAVPAGGTVAVSAAALVVVSLPRPAGLAEHPNDYTWDTAGYAVAQALTAAVVTWLRPRHPVGWLLAVAAALLGAQTFLGAYGAYGVLASSPDWPLARWAAQVGTGLWIPSSALPVTALLLLYPDGKVDGRWTRRLLATSLVSLAGLCAAMAMSATAYRDVVPGGTPPAGVPGWLYVGVLAASAVVFLVSFAATWVHTAIRLVRSASPERAQLAWLVAAVVPLFAATFFLGRTELAALSLVLPAAIAVGIFRHNLFGIQVVLRRWLVYGTLTAAVAGLYLTVAAVAGASVSSGALPGVAAAALVAVGLTPVRDQLQRGVDRFVYGERHDPMRAVVRLGTTVATADEAELLPTVVAGVSQAVRAPAVTIVAADGRVLAGGGQVADTEPLPLRVGGTNVGTLLVARRSPAEDYTDADRALLATLAPHVAVVVRALDLAGELEAERDRVVNATRAERRRYRHDLHDGLGPSLAGVGLGLQAALDAVDTADGDTVRRLLEAVKAETTRSVAEVYRIIDDLRPGALDEAGLTGALRRYTASLAPGMSVDLRVAGPLPVLAADVETAAYRIVTEAMTNVVRHARATTATVTLAVDPTTDRLVITIADDGRGLPPRPRSGGVGLASMTRRAERLGGTMTITSVPSESPIGGDVTDTAGTRSGVRGTVVTATLLLS